MNAVVYCYVVYLLVSVSLTVWVARTLHKNGRIFLVDAFHGNQQMADSVNHLLVVGFYLLNVGFVTLALKYGDPPRNVQESFEYLATKLGLVLLVLGAMHFFNMFNFDKMRRKGRRSETNYPVPRPNPYGSVPADAVPNVAVEALRTVKE